MSMTDHSFNPHKLHRKNKYFFLKKKSHISQKSIFYVKMYASTIVPQMTSHPN